MAKVEDERAFFSEAWIEPPQTSRKKAEPAEKPHYHGHRDRLRERFVAGGPDALPDYELLELLLFRLIPRVDTKPIAKALIARFGSLAEVLGAPASLLEEVKGIGPAVATDLKVIAATARRPRSRPGPRTISGSGRLRSLPVFYSATA